METIKQQLDKKIVDIKKFRVDTLLPKVKVKKLESKELPDLSDETKKYIEKYNSLDSFIDSFVHLTKANEYGKK